MSWRQHPLGCPAISPLISAAIGCCRSTTTTHSVSGSPPCSACRAAIPWPLTPGKVPWACSPTPWWSVPTRSLRKHAPPLPPRLPSVSSARQRSRHWPISSGWSRRSTARPMACLPPCRMLRRPPLIRSAWRALSQVIRSLTRQRLVSRQHLACQVLMRPVRSPWKPLASMPAKSCSPLHPAPTSSRQTLRAQGRGRRSCAKRRHGRRGARASHC